VTVLDRLDQDGLSLSTSLYSSRAVAFATEVGTFGAFSYTLSALNGALIFYCTILLLGLFYIATCLVSSRWF
jgi:hypothetical protein